MRLLSVTVLMLGLLLASVGCDSSNDAAGNDAEVFVGSWTLTNLLLDGQDVSALLLAGTDVDAVFEAAGTYTMTVTSGSGAPVEIDGTYQLDEGAKTLTLTASAFTQDVVIDYDVENENRLRFSTDQVVFLSELAGFDLEGLGLQVDTVTLIIQRDG